MSPSSNPMESLRNDKIAGHHLDRQAVVYVRQSTLQQVETRRESTELQYGLAQRACRLGWSQRQVVVIDEDLGLSAASAAGRAGFQRLVAEVGLGHVGLVLGIEVSRLARSCRDWYQLLEICALAGTLIADNDGVYDPTLYNDRLLLGLKGTMSEAELHIMRARLDEGRRHKAARGELGFALPRGYVRKPSGEIALDPDERVRDAIQLVFDLFERRRSVHGVLRYLVGHNVRLPDRLRHGPAKGDLVWRPPRRCAVNNLLSNPLYAGAYAYGRRTRARAPSDRSRGSGASTPWPVLIKDRAPTYIDWQRFMQNQAQLQANRARHGGPPRGGPSLLSGLLVCGRCGYRMATCYRSNGYGLRYQCSRENVIKGRPLCQSISGAALDPVVEGLILMALRPAALEISLAMAEEIEMERAGRRRRHSLALEQARYEVERAERQYLAVEPENRLVARTLEQRWEQALAEHAHLTAEAARADQSKPARLSAADREAIRRLAEDIPAVWRSSNIAPAERQEIASLMIETVTLEIAGASEQVRIHCRWAGGRVTTHAFVRPVRWTDQLTRSGELRARIAALSKEGLRPPAIARKLAAEGWLSAKGSRFTEAKVRAIMTRMGLPGHGVRPSDEIEREPGEMLIGELAAHLDLPATTLYAWARRGWLTVRRTVTSWREVMLIDRRHAEEVLTERRRAAIRPQEWRPPSPALTNSTDAAT